MTETNIKDVIEIKNKVDVIIRLLAITAISEDRSLQDNAVLLSRSGLTPKEISEILATTPNAIRVALSTARKNNKSKKRKNARG